MGWWFLTAAVLVSIGFAGKKFFPYAKLWKYFGLGPSDGEAFSLEGVDFGNSPDPRRRQARKLQPEPSLGQSGQPLSVSTLPKEGGQSSFAWVGGVLEVTARGVAESAARSRAPADQSQLLEDFLSTASLDRVWQGISSFQNLGGQGREAIQQRLLSLVEEVWFQDLLRAEMLCRSYCPSGLPWDQIGTHLSLAACTLRLLLQQQGIMVASIHLPLTVSEGGGELVRNDRRGLRTLPALSEQVKVQAWRLRDQRSIAIDCLYFGFDIPERNVRRLSRFALYNAAEWR